MKTFDETATGRKWFEMSEYGELVTEPETTCLSEIHESLSEMLTKADVENITSALDSLEVGQAYSHGDYTWRRVANWSPND
jgi:hypothetical protein